MATSDLLRDLLRRGEPQVVIDHPHALHRGGDAAGGVALPTNSPWSLMCSPLSTERTPARLPATLAASCRCAGLFACIDISSRMAARSRREAGGGMRSVRDTSPEQARYQLHSGNFVSATSAPGGTAVPQHPSATVQPSWPNPAALCRREPRARSIGRRAAALVVTVCAEADSTFVCLLTRPRQRQPGAAIGVVATGAIFFRLGGIEPGPMRSGAYFLSCCAAPQ